MKKKTKMKIVEAMSDILEEYDWITRRCAPCPSCGRAPNWENCYCSNCGRKLTDEDGEPLDAHSIEAIWEAYKAGKKADK